MNDKPKEEISPHDADSRRRGGRENHNHNQNHNQTQRRGAELVWQGYVRSWTEEERDGQGDSSTKPETKQEEEKKERERERKANRTRRGSRTQCTRRRRIDPSAPR
jgi:hypothetical protein